jgi:hypothetical protein
VPHVPHTTWVEVCKALEEGEFEVILEVHIGKSIEEVEVS